VDAATVADEVTEVEVLTVGEEVTPEPEVTPSPDRIIRFEIGNEMYTIGSVTQTSDAAPFIDAGTDRTMLPLRVVSSALGAEVDWDADLRVATVVLGTIVIILGVDEPLPDGMGAPMIVDGRVFVPARYVVELLGATVIWDAMSQAVYITA